MSMEIRLKDFANCLNALPDLDAATHRYKHAVEVAVLLSTHWRPSSHLVGEGAPVRAFKT
ncbi:hypothetical protein E4U59_000120 [Claviceps monticola]|nr:hypothetical protein E4U59_000120 [Claviceps monticola]